MTRIKFIDARFFDTDVSPIEERLRTFLKRFRKQKLTGGLIEEGTTPDDPAFDEFGDELMNGFDLSVSRSWWRCISTRRSPTPSRSCRPCRA